MPTDRRSRPTQGLLFLIAGAVALAITGTSALVPSLRTVTAETATSRTTLAHTGWGYSASVVDPVVSGPEDHTGWGR
ncbi:hypothetical protein [Streptomyces sp. NPDC058674]|uniref:hypothetical protein n=1 Tax=Streptomyces sp. NPDC058674 TaxID=3346592 RepID=UPI00364D147B